MSEEKECKYYNHQNYNEESGDTCLLAIIEGLCSCEDVTDCYYKQLQASKAENKKMREALEEVLNGTYSEYDINTGEKIGTFRLSQVQIENVIRQALKELEE